MCLDPRRLCVELTLLGGLRQLGLNARRPRLLHSVEPRLDFGLESRLRSRATERGDGRVERVRARQRGLHPDLHDPLVHFVRHPLNRAGDLRHLLRVILLHRCQILEFAPDVRVDGLDVLPAPCVLGDLVVVVGAEALVLAQSLLGLLLESVIVVLDLPGGEAVPRRRRRRRLQRVHLLGQRSQHLGLLSEGRVEVAMQQLLFCGLRQRGARGP
mmetsp:Transcript_4888/g.8041  ORF Transcript_4888/g.8041 Transcript_4888/m.8041 type:complete len:214 (+) Transcript_4888:550-1191(+)